MEYRCDLMVVLVRTWKWSELRDCVHQEMRRRTTHVTREGVLLLLMMAGKEACIDDTDQDKVRCGKGNHSKWIGFSIADDCLHGFVCEPIIPGYNSIGQPVNLCRNLL